MLRKKKKKKLGFFMKSFNISLLVKGPHQIQSTLPVNRKRQKTQPW
jgi:hypothetical protein